MFGSLREKLQSFVSQASKKAEEKEPQASAPAGDASETEQLIEADTASKAEKESSPHQPAPQESQPSSPNPQETQTPESPEPPADSPPVPATPTPDTPSSEEDTAAAPQPAVEESPAAIPSRKAAPAPMREKKPEKKVKLSAATTVRGMLSGSVTLTESDVDDLLWQLNLDLLQSDVGMQTGQAIIDELKTRIVGTPLPKAEVDQRIREALRDVLTDLMRQGEPIDLPRYVEGHEKPVLILFCGINGTGKTTTIAKVTHLLKEHGHSVVLAAGDTFRAGAIEQIQELGKRLGVKVIAHQKGADSAAVIYDARDHAKAKGVDVVLADSAGRMQTNVNLMDEIRKVVRVNHPDLKIFVGDALTGNDAVEQAKSFHDAVGLDAVILTKLDADAKGGAALSICHAVGAPIIYAGVGQDLADLKKFDVDWYVDQVL